MRAQVTHSSLRILLIFAVVMGSGCSKSDAYRRGQTAGRQIAAEGYLNAGYARELCDGLAAMDGGDAGDFSNGCMDAWNSSVG